MSAGFLSSARTAEKLPAPPEPWLAKELEKFQDLKFGFMMHFGAYSQWGCIESWPLVEEDKWARPDDLKPWIERGKDLARFQQDYFALPKTFNPTKFDPASWAKAAKDCGMKYVVYTTKHHDGFCMFDTKMTEYKITSPDCPFHTHPQADTVRAVFDAFRNEGFVIGVYFSKADWHNPDYWDPARHARTRNPNYDTAAEPKKWQRFVDFVYGQIEELMSNYGPVSLLFLDAGQVRPPTQDINMDRLAAIARRHQPGLIIADRTVGGRYENYLTPEQEVPDKPLPHAWETCMTMGDSWSFKPNDKYKSTHRLIQLLVEIVAKGGNFMLNVGPQPDGQLPAEALSRMKEIGEWMRVNGEAIYATRPIAPYKDGNVSFTHKGNTVYAIYVTKAETDGMPKQIGFSTLRPKAGAEVRVLGVGTPVKWQTDTAGKTTVTIPVAVQKDRPCRHALVVKFELAGEKSQNAVSQNDQQVMIETDALRATIQNKGYVGGISGGTFVDKKTAAQDLGFGLHIIAFSLPSLAAAAQVPVVFEISLEVRLDAVVSFLAEYLAVPTAKLEYDVSWVGNSFSGAGDEWVQNFFIHMITAADGSCFTWSHWDEGGKKFGVYRDGDIVGNKDVKANSLKVKDKQGRTWTINVQYTDPKHQEWDFIPKGIQCDGKSIALPDLFQPTALAVANDGQLMVADSLTGPRQQVLFYDISDLDHPRLTKAFGEYGGIASGTPGKVTPTKFWGIRGIGVDAQDNVYVAMSEMGTVLRKLTPEGELVWELYGHFFVDVACADPLTDGKDVWAIQEHYAMDYTQPAAKQAKWVGYSLDRHKYPNDPRGLMFVKQQGEHGLTSPQIVYLKGKRFMFVGGMFASNFINIFRYDRDGHGEIAIPSGLIMQWGNHLYNTDRQWPPHRPKGKPFIWRDINGDGDYQPDEYMPNTDRVKPGPFCVDKLGNIWMAYGFFRYD
ncbi:MAG: alpha-L-fucosidase, partial [Thermoguttaceae bacterium]